MRPKMKRVPVGLTEMQLEKIDHLVEQGFYPERNEAVRTAIREHL
jgi:Arc/MetJ-type ribon-helix-helix transcriptional regulator